MRCSTVQILATGISQLHGDTVVSTIPKNEIQTIALAHDSRSRRPFLRFMTGFILMVTGLILLIGAFMLAEGGVFLLQMKSITFGIPVLPIVLWALVGLGLWLMMGVFRGRYNYLIKTKQGRRKVFFEEHAGIMDIRDFTERAVRDFGYPIDTALLEQMHFGSQQQTKSEA